MAPMLAANIAGAALLRRTLAQSPRRSPAALVSLASVGFAVEVFVWSERNAGTRTAQALRYPGTELQRVHRHARAERGPARGRPCGAAEILRAEGAPALS